MEWLNNNSGAVTTILTVILIAVNVAYIVSNKRLRKQNDKQWREKTRPRLMMFAFEDEWQHICVEVTNVGEECAFDCRFVLDDEIKDLEYAGKPKCDLSMLETHGIVLTSQKTVSFSIYRTFIILKDTPLGLTCSYKDVSGKEYREHTVFDISIIHLVKGMRCDESQHVEKKMLKEIAGSLKKMVEKAQ